MTQQQFKGFGPPPPPKPPKPPKVPRHIQIAITEFRNGVYHAFLEKDSEALDQLFEEYNPILGKETTNLRFFDVFFTVGKELQDWFSTVDLKNLPKLSK